MDQNIYLDPPKKSPLAPFLLVFILLFVFSASLATAYFFGKSQSPAPITSTITPTAEAPTPTISPTPVNEIYHNQNWSFDLEIPPTWSGYLVTEHDWTTTPKRTYTADVCLSFSLPDALPACILQISIFSSSEWSKLTNKPTLLGQNNGYYFVGNDYDPQCVQLNEFQCTRSQELPQILSTFRFTQ